MCGASGRVETQIRFGDNHAHPEVSGARGGAGERGGEYLFDAFLPFAWHLSFSLSLSLSLPLSFCLAVSFELIPRSPATILGARGVKLNQTSN